MQDFIDFIAEIMEAEPSELNGDTAYNEFEKWDSLMHMRLIMEVEEKYDVEIPIDEVPEIRTLKALYEYTKK
jgi:acyl carrier protein